MLSVALTISTPSALAATSFKDVRKDERMRLSLLLQENAETIGSFAADGTRAVKAVAYLLRMND